MDGQLLLLPSENSRPDSGPLQGSQGLLQTLLDLGETFLASEIGEDDLQDLEAKISAARSRDYGTIRDLQKKIEELSGVSAMMNRLKNELREEKEKAKEEAEDLTQEMAELRYQLMERVDEECELRAQTEEASLRRISELEAQLKHAWQETSILLGRKQSAEAQAQARALELEHLKSAFEVVQGSNFNIDAVVAAKLQQLDQNLKNFQFAEAELRAERAELASQVVWLQAKLEEAELELEAENEKHVVALIQYEEERGLLEAELEAGKQALNMRNTTTVQTAREREVACREDMGLCLEKVVCCKAEQKQMEKTVEALKQSIIEKDQVLAAQKEDLLVQKEINKSLMSHSALLDCELLTVRKELLLCESQANEMGSTIANLQEALLLERIKTAKAQEDTNLQTRRLSRQDEDYLHLKTSFDGLVSNLETVQMNLADSRKSEREASAQVKKLGLELFLVKQEVVKLEVRLQRALKQKEEQLDAERGKLETAIAAQKQAEWHLHKQAEELKNSEGERIELHRLLGQVRGTCDQLKRERDDLKVAYAELENQFLRRRTAFAR